jgi:hypothetical protein
MCEQYQVVDDASVELLEGVRVLVPVVVALDLEVSRRRVYARA